MKPYYALCLLFLGTSLFAQLWSGVIDGSRAIDWSHAGVVGGIPARASICTTLSPGVTAAQISTAIQTCGAGNVVFLNAGTYNLTSGINFGSVNNVTLRGAGANQTLLVFSGNYNCLGRGSLICISASSNPGIPNPNNFTTWSGTTEGGVNSYPIGATHLILGSTSGMAAGNILVLDQLDEATDTGNIWNCATSSCTEQGGNSQGRSGRSQQQLVKIVSITDGTHVIVTPGLYMPNWRQSQSPGAFWTNVSTHDDGVENLSIDGTNAGITANAGGNVVLQYVSNCWVKGIRSIKDPRAHVWVLQSVHNTIRDSYFYGTLYSTSTSYGVEVLSGSDHLIENNILDTVVGGNQEGGGGVGDVWGYNFAIHDGFTTPATWLIASDIQHDSGITFDLTESNDGIGYTADNIHGTHHFQTMFRSYFYGDIWNNPPKTADTNVIHLRAFSRYYNIVGNVLGRSYYTGYQQINADSTQFIYSLNSGAVVNDSLTSSTLMRWGNWDNVSNAVRWCGNSTNPGWATTCSSTSEVPSGLSLYANAVPASTTLPNSFYLSGQPPWWQFPNGTVAPFPAIGPDVTGGNLSGTAGHAYMIPARNCWYNVMGGTVGSSALLNFNAATCYPTTAPPTSIPTGVSVIIPGAI